MRNNRGVTIVALAATIIILIILASMTIITSMDAYNQMQYESFKAELEELQKAVDVIAEEYKMASQLNTYSGYGDFFSDRYNKNISKLDASSIALSYKTLFGKYESELSGGETYLFTPADIKEVLNIKGIEEDFIINFSTRRVYSVTPHKDPNGENGLIFRLPDSDLTTNYVKPKDQSALTNASLEYPVSAREYIIDGTKMYQVILRIRYTENSNKISQKYDIAKIEYIVNSKTIEIDDFEQYMVLDGNDILKELKFIVYEKPSNNSYFSFRIYDTEGVNIEMLPIGFGNF